jgi:hypothetical protein
LRISDLIGALFERTSLTMCKEIALRGQRRSRVGEAGRAIALD